jgi:hypothetical protein
MFDSRIQFIEFSSEAKLQKSISRNKNFENLLTEKVS